MSKCGLSTGNEQFENQTINVRKYRETCEAIPTGRYESLPASGGQSCKLFIISALRFLWDFVWFSAYAVLMGKILKLWYFAIGIYRLSAVKR